MSGNRGGLVIVLALGLSASSTAALAQQDYPSQTISIVLPYTPSAGGATIVARQLSDLLRPLTGVPVIVEHKPGGQTNIAAAHVARAKPNGYTLLLTSGSSTFAFNTHLFKTLPFDPRKSFTPVTTLTSVPFVLIVNTSQNVFTVDDLTRLLRAKKDRGSYGSATPFTAVITELYKMRAGVETVRIPYKGAEQVWPELGAGGLDFAFADPANAAVALKQKWARAIAVSSAKRFWQYPDVPTMIESGVPGFDAESWLAIYAPAGTPQSIVEKLSNWINRVMATDELKKAMNAMRYSPMPGSPESLEKHHMAEIEKWGRLIRAAKLEHSVE